MKIFQYDFPNMFIKVSARREYLEDIASGKIYMNESGYFRKLEDVFRGDKYEGKCPVSLSDLSGQTFKLGPLDNDEESITIPIEWVSNFVIGFQNDDKVPLFCCSMLTEDILEKETEYLFAFKEEFISEMKKFGKYLLLFNADELRESIKKYISGDQLLGGKYGPVTYGNIKTIYSLDMLNDEDRDHYGRFFNKDFSYRWQNEWRLLLVAQQPLIGPNENHYVAEVEPLTWFHIMEVDDLRINKFVIRNEEDL